MIRNKNIVHSFLLCLLIGSTTVYHTPINTLTPEQHALIQSLILINEVAITSFCAGKYGERKQLSPAKQCVLYTVTTVVNFVVYIGLLCLTKSIENK